MRIDVGMPFTVSGVCSAVIIIIFHFFPFHRIPSNRTRAQCKMVRKIVFCAGLPRTAMIFFFLHSCADVPSIDLPPGGRRSRHLPLYIIIIIRLPQVCKNGSTGSADFFVIVRTEVCVNEYSPEKSEIRSRFSDKNKMFVDLPDMV